mmetsp:Transcript_12513/g.36438  ORF Transcript_12513/g.36438 Transcript_12513/m.36438 type:complete len:240 (+) Transcript_12513:361-1080(+)
MRSPSLSAETLTSSAATSRLASSQVIEEGPLAGSRKCSVPPASPASLASPSLPVSLARDRSSNNEATSNSARTLAPKFPAISTQPCTASLVSAWTRMAEAESSWIWLSSTACTLLPESRPVLPLKSPRRKFSVEMKLSTGSFSSRRSQSSQESSVTPVLAQRAWRRSRKFNTRNAWQTGPRLPLRRTRRSEYVSQEPSRATWRSSKAKAGRLPWEPDTQLTSASGISTATDSCPAALGF